MIAQTEYEKVQNFNFITSFLHSCRFKKTLYVLLKYSLLNDKKAFKIVEIGCAHAKLYSFINNKFNFEYIGIEPCEKSFEAASSRYNKESNFSIKHGVAEKVLDSIESADVVIALETLEHIPENIVVRIVEKISQKQPKLFICSVPIEIGPIVWIKNIGSWLMGYIRHKEYSWQETFWSGLGKLDKLPPHGTGHKGFNYLWLMQTIRHNFKIIEATRFPFSWLPYKLSTNIFMVSHSRNKAYLS